MCLDLSDLPALAADDAAVLEASDDPSSRGCLRIGCTVSAGGILMFVESILLVGSIYRRLLLLIDVMRTGEGGSEK